MTAALCKACSHPDRGVIDRALLRAGQSPRSIERRYRGISRREIREHRDECLAAANPGDGVR